MITEIVGTHKKTIKHPKLKKTQYCHEGTGEDS
jgi:hypothetical protein